MIDTAQVPHQGSPKENVGFLYIQENVFAYYKFWKYLQTSNIGHVIAGSANEKDSSRFPSDVDKEEWDEEQKVFQFSSRINVVSKKKNWTTLMIQFSHH